jgi:hypothetical protein
MSEYAIKPVNKGLPRFESKKPMCENRENIASWKQVQRHDFERDRAI